MCFTQKNQNRNLEQTDIWTVISTIKMKVKYSTWNIGKKLCEQLNHNYREIISWKYNQARSNKGSIKLVFIIYNSEQYTLKVRIYTSAHCKTVYIWIEIHVSLNRIHRTRIFTWKIYYYYDKNDKILKKKKP